MKKLPPLLSVLSLLTCAVVCSASDSILLADFDSPPDPMLSFVEEPELVWFGNTQGGKIQASGFKQVMRIRIPRERLLDVLANTPVLTMKLLAAAEENPARFVKLTLVLQHNVDGVQQHEPVISAFCNPLRDESFTFDLSKLTTASVSDLKELAQRYAEGVGTKFVFVVVQQTPKGEVSKVHYDDVQLVARTGD